MRRRAGGEGAPALSWRYSLAMTTTTPWHRTEPALLVILAGVVAALHVGKLPPAIPVLRDALGLTLVQAGFLLSLVQLAGMAVGVLFGMVADGLGGRRSMMLGLALLAVVSALGGLTQGVAPMMLLRAAEGFGFLLVVLPAPGLVRALVAPQRVSAMIGPVGRLHAAGHGPGVAARAVGRSPTIGWRGWWGALAALSAAMAAWLRHARAGRSTRPAAAAAPSSALARLRRTLAAPGPWLVAVSFAMYSGQWLAVDRLPAVDLCPERHRRQPWRACSRPPSPPSTWSATSAPADCCSAASRRLAC